MVIYYYQFTFRSDILKLPSWNLNRIRFSATQALWEESDTVRFTAIPRWLELSIRIFWKITHLSAIVTAEEFITLQAHYN